MGQADEGVPAVLARGFPYAARETAPRGSSCGPARRTSSDDRCARGRRRRRAPRGRPRGRAAARATDHRRQHRRRFRASRPHDLPRSRHGHVHARRRSTIPRPAGGARTKRGASWRRCSGSAARRGSNWAIATSPCTSCGRTRWQRGETLSEITRDAVPALGQFDHAVLPMSDDPGADVRAHRRRASLRFQDYFVRRSCEPRRVGHSVLREAKRRACLPRCGPS